MIFLTVDDLFSFVKNLTMKNLSTGISNELFENMWHVEQISYQGDLLGRFQARNNGKAGANTGLIENETILQKLSPFIDTSTVISVSSGIGVKPEDLVYRLSLMVNGYDCQKINFNQRDSVTHSVIDPPSATDNKYYFLEYAGRYEFLPASVSSALLDYVKLPTKIKWGFNYNDDEEMIYNEGSSVHPQWDLASCQEITQRMLTLLGVSFKDSDFSNFGQQVIATGSK
jgi:hypothetical protein